MECHLTNVNLLRPESGLRRDSTLVISDGRVRQIYDVGEAIAGASSCEVIDGRGALCLPGLINTHNHSPLMIVRGMVEDLGFAPAYTPGVPQGHWLSFEETLALARLGVMELLCAGSTTIVDYYRYPDALAQAADELGIRAIVGGRIMDVDTADLAQGKFTNDRALGESTLADAMALTEKWDGRPNNRISTVLAPHAPDTCSLELLREISKLAEQTGKQVHTHLAQSQLEMEFVGSLYSRTSAELLDETGLLTDKLVAAHCIFLTSSDIARLGQNRVVVAHAPIGNAAFGAAAPIHDLLSAGARITLCTDTKSGDMFEAMRMAIASARWRAKMEFVLNAGQVFSWATLEAAQALKDHGASGALRVGDPADLILMDPNAANIRPVIDGVGIIVHSANGANVTDVMVGGEWLVRDRRPTRVDADEVIGTAQAVAERLWDRARG
jgi:5-methylthioadenosine/S-adenosylhomocysteine deaminase